MGISQNSKRYKPTEKSGDALVTERLKALSARWKQFGYRRLHVMLLREGFEINHKKTYRLYKNAGLTLQKRSKKKKSLSEARKIIEDWRLEYNRVRPRSSLDNLTPEEYALKLSSSYEHSLCTKSGGRSL